MLKAIVPLQMDIKPQQAPVNNQDFARPDKSKTTESESFNNIFEREVADKESKLDNGEKHTDTASESDHNENQEQSRHTNTDAAAKTKQDQQAHSDTSTERDITDETVHVSQIPIAQIQPQNHLNPTTQNQVAGQNQTTVMSALFGQNIWEKQNPLQSAQTANSADGGNDLPQFAALKQSLFDENNELMQSLRAVNAVNGNKELQLQLTRYAESGALMHADYETMHPSGLNGLTQLSSQSTQLTLQTATPQSLGLDTQIGQPKWSNDFAQKIVWLANQQHQVAELRLNPAHLGPVEIVLSLTHENGTQASAQFVSPHLSVREAIEAALPKLRELMAENGIQLGDVSVGAESFQQHEKGEQYPNKHHLTDGLRDVDTSGYNSANPEKPVVSSRHTGLVNTFA